MACSLLPRLYTVLLLAVAVHHFPFASADGDGVVYLHRKTVLRTPPTFLTSQVRRGSRFRRERHRVNLGHGQGSYWTNVSVAGGRYPVDVDTGSSLFAVPSVQCHACATDDECEHHKGPMCPGPTHYDVAKSEYGRLLDCPPAGNAGFTCSAATGNLTCGGITQPSCACRKAPGDEQKHAAIMQCYADGSGWQGALVSDYFKIAGLSARVLFVAKDLNIKDDESGGPFYGIIGMAYHTLSGVNTPFEHLVDQGSVRNLFTMCLGPSGGSLFLGGGDTGTGIRYTSIIQQSYYVVTMKDLLVNGTSVGVNASIYNEGQCIVDSGTTDLALPHSAYIAFYNLLQQACSAGKNLVGVCGLSFDKSLFGGYEFTMTQNDVAAFPTLTVVLDGVELALPPQLYLVTPPNSYTSLAVVDMGDDVSGTILGDTLMRGFQVVFDREHLRVGFGPRSNCFQL